MEQRVVCGGDGPSQAGLTRTRRFQVRQMLSQFEQIVGIRHRSGPRFFLHHGLLGLAAETEIRQDAPLFEGLEPLSYRISEMARGIPQLISAAGSVGDYDSEEDSRLSTPILPKRVLQTHDIGAECWLEIVDSLFELRLLCERSGNVHYLIIAHSRYNEPAQSGFKDRLIFLPG